GGPASARRRGRNGQDDGPAERLGLQHHQAGRQLRRELRAQRRPEDAAGPRPRPQRTLEQGRVAVRSAGSLKRQSYGSDVGRVRFCRQNRRARCISARSPRDGSSAMAVITELRGASTGSFWRNEFVRGIAIQVLAILILAAVAGFLVHNTAVNLEKRGIASGFGFLGNPAGFDIGIALIPYSMAGSSYFQAFLVSVVNTLVVSAAGIVIGTVLGFVIGIARLSRNWLIANLAAVYVDVIRNIPLLAQIIFWYFGLLPLLPQVRQSVPIFDAFFFSNRGLYMPKLV